MHHLFSVSSSAGKLNVTKVSDRLNLTTLSSSIRHNSETNSVKLVGSIFLWIWCNKNQSPKSTRDALFGRLSFFNLVEIMIFHRRKTYHCISASVFLQFCEKDLQRLTLEPMVEVNSFIKILITEFRPFLMSKRMAHFSNNN